ncbi:hypothetical protein [Wenyingzhuangia sp. 2_MG-2023]|uniref:hypothetical protein n=1 Tax=Wenyingzhuangia sp. 2_MG-2023 TaxID=3062639 RepID=UPI0026E22279|nr:hypothetical protein [Wenyingzhuangia sp. 2_MG-2023]MDO6739432.1 hypothetical protein [Wenyingzhuangia sp. 2_MG-2023]
MKFFKIIYLITLIYVVSCNNKNFTAANGDKHEVSSLVGKNVFEIVNDYSKTNSETLKGTNNQNWIVYFPDIDITVISNKSTNIVTNAFKGKGIN